MRVTPKGTDRGSGIDVDRLTAVLNRLGDAVVDPAAWTAILEDICRAVGASAALLLQSDVRTPDVPRTQSIDEGTRLYFAKGWHELDPRAKGFPRMMAGEIITDHDLLRPEQIRTDPMYNELLYPFGFHWFAGIGFQAGAASWALTIQRTASEGPISADDKRLLARLGPRLTETATLATAVGRIKLTSMTNALDNVRQPALILDRSGAVLSTNASAEAGFDGEIRVRNRQLIVRDKAAMAGIARLIDMFKSAPEGAALPAAPVLIRRTGKPPVLLRLLPIDGVAQTVFVGARALVVLSNLLPRPAPKPALMLEAFGLTPAEARLASLLAGGLTLNEASEQLSISRATARNHLKAIFAKTDTHRQVELVNLISQLA